MGTFYARCKLENPSDRSRSVIIPKLLVDTGSELTWVSERMLERIGIGREKKDLRFVLANGQEVTRSVGFAIIRLDKYLYNRRSGLCRTRRPATSGGAHARRTEFDHRTR